jgi:hypothetical protein
MSPVRGDLRLALEAVERGFPFADTTRPHARQKALAFLAERGPIRISHEGAALGYRLTPRGHEALRRPEVA